MNENKKAMQAISELMAMNGDANEAYICEWISRLLKNTTVKNFLELSDNNIVWLELAELGKFKAVALEAPYFTNKNLQNYVNLLSDIWKAEKDMDVFGYFGDYLSEVFNPAFVFVENFEDCLYSHTHEVIHIIVITTLLTSMMIYHTHFTEDGLEQWFDCMEDIEDDTRNILKEEFKLVIELYDTIEEDFSDESQIREPAMTVVSTTNRNRGVTSMAEQHIAKKVEELQKIIDTLKAENDEMKLKNGSVAKDMAEKTKLIEEQEFKIKQLNFSRDDILEKLKNKKFEMINEEIQDKQKEINDLKEMLTNTEAKYQKRLRDAEETKDELIKKLHLLENYKSEFETLRRVTESQRREIREGPTDDEVQRLKDQVVKLQQASLEDKQRCLNLEMQVSEISIQAQRLRLENQDLNYRVKELENDKSFGASEIYVDDYEMIKEELSAAKHIKKMDEPTSESEKDLAGDFLNTMNYKGDPKITPFNSIEANESQNKEPNQKRADQIFFDYEKKCLHRIKMILKESREYKDKLSEVLQELEELNEENDELEEKVNNLETKAVESIVINSKELKELIYNVKNTERDSSEIAQDLLKNIIKKDLEIARLKHNRKRAQKETLELETTFADRLSLVYEVVESYVNNS